MTSSFEYAPPKVWSWDKPNGGRFANINRPIAGPTHDKELPLGRHPIQLYSQGTPNGVKVAVMLEELLALGNSAQNTTLGSSESTAAINSGAASLR
jgi:GST-like protein